MDQPGLNPAYPSRWPAVSHYLGDWIYRVTHWWPSEHPVVRIPAGLGHIKNSGWFSFFFTSLLTQLRKSLPFEGNDPRGGDGSGHKYSLLEWVRIGPEMSQAGLGLTHCNSFEGRTSHGREEIIGFMVRWAHTGLVTTPPPGRGKLGDAKEVNSGWRWVIASLHTKQTHGRRNAEPGGDWIGLLLLAQGEMIQRWRSILKGLGFARNPTKVSVQNWFRLRHF